LFSRTNAKVSKLLLLNGVVSMDDYTRAYKFIQKISILPDGLTECLCMNWH
jgi:hypothetical protein